MDDQPKTDDRRRERNDALRQKRDDYTPNVLNDLPQEFRFKDWASI